MFRHLAIIALTAGLAAPTPIAAQETYTAAQIAKFAVQRGAPGLTAMFRGKTITVEGTFNRFVDTGYGTMVYVVFDHPEANSWEVNCRFPRADIAAYDRFALMPGGMPISATGTFLAAEDVFFAFKLEPCQMH